MKNFFKLFGTSFLCLSLLVSISACNDKKKKSTIKIRETSTPTASDTNSPTVSDNTASPTSNSTLKDDTTINPSTSSGPDVNLSYQPSDITTHTELDKNEKSEIAKTIKDYAKANMSFDFKDALKYVSEDSELYTTLSSWSDLNLELKDFIDINSDLSKALNIDKKNFEDKLITEISDLLLDTLSDSTAPVVDTDNIDYKEGSKDEILVKYELKSLDVDKITAEVKEKFNSNYDTEYKNLDKEDQKNFLTESLPEIYDEVISSDLEITSKGTITLKKVDDDWLIISDDASE